MATQVTTVRQMATLQKVQLTILFLTAITFPIILNYFSAFLIVEVSTQGMMTSSFFFWTLFTLTALLFSRVAYGYVYRLAVYQEAEERMSLPRDNP